MNLDVAKRCHSILKTIESDPKNQYMAADYPSSAFLSGDGAKFAEPLMDFIGRHPNPYVVGRLCEGVGLSGDASLLPKLKEILATLPQGFRKDSVLHAIERTDPHYEGPPCLRGQEETILAALQSTQNPRGCPESR